MKENRAAYVDINKEIPLWEDRVKLLFRVENGRLYRNMLPLCYFRIRRNLYGWINKCKDFIKVDKLMFTGVKYSTYEIIFYLHYGYKAKRLFVMNEAREPYLEDVKDFSNRPYLHNTFLNKKSEITIEYLRQCLYLKGEELFYNQRPVWHFKSYPAYLRWNKEYAHKNVDNFLCLDGDGYEQVNTPPFMSQKHRVKIQLKIGRILDPKNEVIDHINRNKIDNSFDNLRITTPKINACNTGKQVSSIVKYTSKYKGVGKAKGRNWRAKIRKDSKEVTIGTFITELEAAQAYDNFIIKHNLPNLSNKDLGLL